VARDRRALPRPRPHAGRDRQDGHGAVWAYHADYCGDVEGSQWHGDGTFSLTSPGGDSLTGTLSVGSLTMGTAGSPRLVAITGGSGAWAGATGSCLIDETVQVSSFG
jgi:hypothetical protein